MVTLWRMTLWRRRPYSLWGHVELLPEALEYGSEEVGGVEAGHRDEQEVEGVAHLLAGEDDGGQAVAHDPQDGHGRLEEVLFSVWVSAGSIAFNLESIQNQINSWMLHH